MKAIFVDDEIWMLQQFKNECEGIGGIDLLQAFTDPFEALKYAESNEIDLAFLDIEMPGMNGLDLSVKLRRLYPNIVVIFVSAYDDYMSEAFREKDADHYIVKPYRHEQLKSAVDRANKLMNRRERHVFFETFGRFSVYVNDRHLKIQSPKAKELLALLADRRGAVLGAEEAFYILWEDRSWNHDSAKAFYKVLKRLRTVLEEAGIGDILNVDKGEYRLDTSKVTCDYYLFLDGDKEARRRFNGVYMADYSWGETTAAKLNRTQEVAS